MIRGNRKRLSGILFNPAYRGEIVWNRHKYSKNPETMGSTRIGRQNNPDEWIRTPAPQYRILDADLAARVTARQDALTRTAPPYRKVPPKLLSFLLRCGECGGGMAMTGRTKYGCSRAVHNGGCGNRLGIRRNDQRSQVAADAPGAVQGIL